jgi:hypothetical protein
LSEFSQEMVDQVIEHTHRHTHRHTRFLSPDVLTRTVHIY